MKFYKSILLSIILFSTSLCSLFAQKDSVPKAFSQNGKWGFKISDSNEELIPAIYDSVSSFYGKYAVVKDGKTWILIQNNRNYIVSTGYDSVCIHPRVLILHKENKWTFYDQVGNNAGDYDAFLHLISNDTLFSEPLYYFVNKGGRLNDAIHRDTANIINPDTDELMQVFIDSKFPYFKGGKIGILTGSGKEFLPPNANNICFVGHYFTDESNSQRKNSFNLKDSIYMSGEYPFYCDFNHPFLIEKDNYWGILSKRGSWILKPQFDSLFYSFDGGYKGYFENHKFLISPSGAVSPSFDAEMEFRYTGGSDLDFYIICRGGTIKKSKRAEFKEIWDGNYQEIIEEYPYFENGLLGLIGVSGESYLEPVYDDFQIALIPSVEHDYTLNALKLRSMKDSTFKKLTTDTRPEIPLWVCKENKWGLYKIKDKWLLPVKYDAIQRFCYKDSCFYIVRNNQKNALVSSDGKFLTAQDYDYIDVQYFIESIDLSKLRLKVLKEGLYGFIGIDGKEYIKPENVFISSLNSDNFKFTKNGKTVFFIKVEDVQTYNEYGEPSMIKVVSKDSIVIGAKYGICNINGQILVPDTLDRVGEIYGLPYSQTGTDTLISIQTDIDSLKGKFVAVPFTQPNTRYTLYDITGKVLITGCTHLINVSAYDANNLGYTNKGGLILTKNNENYFLFSEQGEPVPVKKEWISKIEEWLK